MKVKMLAGERFKEKPQDCVVESHALMIRGGYIKQVGNGIFSLFTPAKRIVQKIENIIREEMDAIDGQEVSFPVVFPASLLEESRRYDAIGLELLRFKDRNNSPCVLGMTHEEPAVHLARDFAKSYTRYPFMVYQINTKFRDEARPRAGLIRVREFAMKDAYSFHTSQKDLEEYYDKCFEAYNKIFKRVGIPEVIAVKSDSGMMGGKVAHEFMLLSPIGEDSIVICSKCDYKANMEASETIVDKNDNVLPIAQLKKEYTPNNKTIEDVVKTLKREAKDICKAVIYQKNKDDKLVVVFIRGDLDVNETKLTNFLGENIHPATLVDNKVLNAGFCGPYNLNAKDITILFDRSLEGVQNLACGANEIDYHYTGLNFKRDIKDATFHDFAKSFQGSICPKCGQKAITVSRGIEVGNIFQLGTRYTESMDMKYLDSDGKEHFPIMGCYGIGVGRLMASICEVKHDEHGPIWPISIAPWQVQICVLRADDESVKSLADVLYADLQKDKIEVLYDDREVSTGVMFSDADLFGVPIRVVVSPRNIKNNVVEISLRDKSFKEEVKVGDAKERIKELIRKLLSKFE
ncbi:MAG: proline--tRNA ligase [Bdellovibrionota bacterium]